MKRCLLTALLVMPLLGSDSPKDFEDGTDFVGIEGTWRIIGNEEGGKMKKLDTPSWLTLRNGTATRKEWNGDTRRWGYRIDSSRKPPHLDWFPLNELDKRKTIKCIYQIQGDMLRIADIYGPSVERPRGFNDEGLDVWTYKRVKGPFFL